MKKILIALLQVVISAVCFYVAYVGFSHGSSAGFELGIGLGLVGLIHWAFWGR